MNDDSAGLHDAAKFIAECDWLAQGIKYAQSEYRIERARFKR